MRIKVWNSFIVVIIMIFVLQAAAYSQNTDSTISSTIIKRKSPTGALFRSVFVPGWGQFYNKKYIKATIIAGVEVYLMNQVYTHWHKADLHEKHFTSSFDRPGYQASEYALYKKELDRRGYASWFLAATIFYSMFDAYVDAQLSDFNQPDKAFSFYLGPGEDQDVVAVVTFNLP